MTFEEAHAAAKALNENGVHRHEWFYYPAYYDGENPKFVGSHFVMRRPKRVQLHVAIFGDGTLSKLEG